MGCHRKIPGGELQQQKEFLQVCRLEVRDRGVRVDGCISGQMSGWMNKWVGGRMDGWMGRWVDGWMGGWVGGWVSGWVDGWMDGWVDKWMNGWIGGLVDGWMDGCVNSMGSMHTVEYYTAMKKSAALIQATVWLDLEHMMLSERSRHRRMHVCDSIDRKRPEQANPQRQEVD